MENSEIQASQNKIKSMRRTWALEEDRCLTDCLIQMHREGKYRSEGGFKPGHLLYLEQLMSKKLPDCGLKASNIDSRLSYLKRQFFALYEIKEKGSGFGWDDEKKMVTGDRVVFDEWVKSHKDAKGLYRKPWPLYDDFEEVYARDRATGNKAANAADREDQEVNQATNKVKESNLNHGNGTQNLLSTDDPITEETNNDSCKKQKKTSKKQVEELQGKYVEMMQQIIEKNNESVAQLMQTLTAVEKNERANLRDVLGLVSKLTTSEILHAMRKMSNDDVTMFFTLKNEDEKYEFVQMVLGNI